MSVMFVILYSFITQNLVLYISGDTARVNVSHK